MIDGEIITRGMVVTLLHNLSKNDLIKKNFIIKDSLKDETIKFEDVEENMYYSEAIEWATSLDIVNGVGENKFAPNKNVTREELATIIFRFIEKMNINVPAVLMLYPPYDDDESISEYAKVAVEQMRYTRLMLGNEENKFEPKADVTKAEAEDIFTKLIKAIDEQKGE